MTVHHLATHMLRGALRVRQVAEHPARGEQPELDRLTYWAPSNYDPVADGPEIVARAIEGAPEAPPDAFPELWREHWRGALALAEGLIAEDPVCEGPFGRMRVSDYLTTRHIEVVIHHTDLRDALGIPPDPDAGALDVVCDILAGLLGTDPRRLGIEALRFALIGTGRAELDQRERDLLGPLTARLPLIS